MPLATEATRLAQLINQKVDDKSCRGALADPTRRAILQRLSAGEARVTELAEPFAMSLNAVSKHIRMLERAKLVRRRKAGREHYLAFDPAPLEAVASWIEQQRALWNQRLDALESLLRDEDRAAAVTESRKPVRKPRRAKRNEKRSR